jgi:hypothetical protein
MGSPRLGAPPAGGKTDSRDKSGRPSFQRENGAAQFDHSIYSLLRPIQQYSNSSILFRKFSELLDRINKLAQIGSKKAFAAYLGLTEWRNQSTMFVVN